MCRATAIEKFEQRLCSCCLTTMCKENIRLKRSVRFHDVPTKATVPSLDSMQEDQIDQLWYRHDEIELFRTQARSLCRELRRRPLMPSESVRGLEYRTDMERQQRKCMTIKCVVRAQKRFSDDPLRLSRIYSKCSAWSMMVASAVADNDFYSAYDLAFKCDIPALSEYPLPFRSKSKNKKRDMSPFLKSNEAHRRVRRRIEAIV